MSIGGQASAVLIGCFCVCLLWSILQIKRLIGHEGIAPIIKVSFCIMFLYTFITIGHPLYYQIFVLGPPVIKWNSFRSMSSIFTIFYSTVLCVLTANQVIKGSWIQLVLSSLSVIWGVVSIYLIFIWSKTVPGFSSQATLFNPYFAFNYLLTGLLFLGLSLSNGARQHRIKCVANKVRIPSFLVLSVVLLHVQLITGLLAGLFSKDISGVILASGGFLIMFALIWIPVLLGLRWGDPFALLIFRIWAIAYFLFALVTLLKQLLAKPFPMVSFAQISYVATFSFVLWLCFSPSVQNWRKQLKPVF